MTNGPLKVWHPNKTVVLPKNLESAETAMDLAPQLSRKDKQQIVQAFTAGNFEMLSEFVWNKTIRTVKKQLGNLGMIFISEILNRPDIKEASNIEEVLTDFDAIRLAENLGAIGGTGAFRLKRAMEAVYHFNNLDGEDNDPGEMSREEAVSVLRACVENVLGQESFHAAVDFANFRKQLELQVFDEEADEVQKIVNSPYFFQRTAIRVLLSLVKTASGAQLENTLDNANVLIPLVWGKLEKTERWQIGTSYAEVMAEGNKDASKGLRKVLLQVRGFDYVPEDLRSRSFILAATKVIQAHEGMNNFYNEPAPMKLLSSMGTTIPAPALPSCMSAALAVKLGNTWGRCWGAQVHADLLLDNLKSDRWKTFCIDYLKADERILYKLLDSKPRNRWYEVVRKYNLAEISVSTPEINELLRASAREHDTQTADAAKKLLKRLGHEVE